MSELKFKNTESSTESDILSFYKETEKLINPNKIFIEMQKETANTDIKIIFKSHPIIYETAISKILQAISDVKKIQKNTNSFIDKNYAAEKINRLLQSSQSIFESGFLDAERKSEIYVNEKFVCTVRTHLQHRGKLISDIFNKEGYRIISFYHDDDNRLEYVKKYIINLCYDRYFM